MNSAGNKILSKFPHLSAITVSHHSTPIITELILNFGEKRMWSLLTKKDVVTFDQKVCGHFWPKRMGSLLTKKDGVTFDQKGWGYFWPKRMGSLLTKKDGVTFDQKGCGHFWHDFLKSLKFILTDFLWLLFRQYMLFIYLRLLAVYHHGCRILMLSYIYVTNNIFHLLIFTKPTTHNK